MRTICSSAGWNDAMLWSRPPVCWWGVLWTPVSCHQTGADFKSRSEALRPRGRKASERDLKSAPVWWQLVGVQRTPHQQTGGLLHSIASFQPALEQIVLIQPEVMA